MKFEALHLKAFGAFDDRNLDFSGGDAGFHLVYGPNEAGKSTTLRAITQFLYGIEARTADDFLHPMKNLRIGATLSNGPARLACYRRKGNKGTLLAEDEKTTLDDDALAPFLAGVNEETFKNLFGLTHEQLVRGGEALVAGEGDVGQALFSAAAGTGNLKELLVRLDERAGELFKPTGSKPRINAALREYKEHKRAIKEAQLRPQAWKELHQTSQAAEAQRRTLDTRIQEARAEASRLDRIRQALPLVAKRLTLLEELDPLQNVVVLDGDFTERRHACETAQFSAREARTTAIRALEEINAALAALPVNDVLLAHEDTIEDLNQRLGAYRKAQQDRDQELAPRLQVLETEAERTLRHLRPNWTLDQVEELRLAPGQQQHINELSRRGEALKTKRDSATTAQKKLRREQVQAREALASLGSPVDPAPVERAAKRAAQVLEAEESLAAQRRSVKDKTEALEAGIARLGLWSGTPEALEALPVPSAATIERFRLDRDKAHTEQEAAIARIASIQGELQQAREQLAAYQKAHDAPSLAALEEIRRERQRGWGLARAAWEAGTTPDALNEAEARRYTDGVREGHPEVENLADAYGVLVESADSVADRLRNEADRVATLAQLESNVTLLTSGLEDARAVETVLAEAVAAVEVAWRDAWIPAGITPLTPAEMAVWKQEHSALLQSIHTLREAREGLAASAASGEGHHARLVEALAAVDVSVEGMGLADGLALAEEWITRQHELANERAQHERRIAALDTTEIPEADADLADLDEKLDVWNGAWAAMAEELGAPAAASPGEILARTQAIDALLAQYDESLELRARIARIEADHDAFRAEVAVLADAVAPERAGQPEAALVQALYGELKQQREIRKEREGRLKRRDEEATRLREADARLARAEEELQQCCTEAGVASLEALPAAEKASATRQRLEAAQLEAESQLLTLSPGQRLDDFLDQVAAEDPDTVVPALENLATTVKALEDERSNLLIEIGNLKNQLAQMDGSDKAAGLAEEAQSILSAIAVDGEEYARLKVAAFVLGKAIEAYRAANQEPMLARAGEIFGQLTLGSFTGLLADYDDKGRHLLCGERPEDRTRVHVSGMSEGTADQLYLALRLASLERHLEKHPPIPLVLDDILVNFDDARTGATLDVLADFSRRTQVIYFTHHQHLVELARARLDKKTLFTHDLTAG